MSARLDPSRKVVASPSADAPSVAGAWTSRHAGATGRQAFAGVPPRDAEAWARWTPVAYLNVGKGCVRPPPERSPDLGESGPWRRRTLSRCRRGGDLPSLARGRLAASARARELRDLDAWPHARRGRVHPRQLRASGRAGGDDVLRRRDGAARRAGHRPRRSSSRRSSSRTSRTRTTPFPHIYGPLNPSAVVEVRAVTVTDAGLQFTDEPS